MLCGRARAAHTPCAAQHQRHSTAPSSLTAHVRAASGSPTHARALLVEAHHLRQSQSLVSHRITTRRRVSGLPHPLLAHTRAAASQITKRVRSSPSDDTQRHARTHGRLTLRAPSLRRESGSSRRQEEPAAPTPTPQNDRGKRRNKKQHLCGCGGGEAACCRRPSLQGCRPRRLRAWLRCCWKDF